MNPFDWSGPAFLVFYLLLSVVLIAIQLWMMRAREAATHVRALTPSFSDPYLVAYLAGGANGLTRCVIVALLERKVLSVIEAKRTHEVVLNSQMTQLIQSPLESVVASLFQRQRSAFSVFKEAAMAPEAKAAEQQFRTALEAAGLLAGPEQRSTNLRNALTVAGVLAGMAAIKVLLALERGHRNVGFLIVLGVLSCLAALLFSRRRVTVPGREALEDLRRLLGGLREQTRSGALNTVSPADVAFVAAVFGLGALGGSRQMYGKDLFPSAGSSNGCGSSCGSSDSGGGGSCGGGGGCGGCGGS